MFYPALMLLCAMSPPGLAWVAPDPQAIEEVAAGKRTVANAAWWGFDPMDSTRYLQAAINSKASTVIIPNMGQDWIVRPIFLRSNLELVFEEGVVVTAKKGDYFGKHDSVFTARISRTSRSRAMVPPFACIKMTTPSRIIRRASIAGESISAAAITFRC